MIHAIGIIFCIPVFLFTVWVDKIVWNWFMPELFGLPIMTFWGMAGLSIVLNSLTKASTIHIAKTYDKVEPQERYAHLIVGGLAIHSITLVLGWLFKSAAF